MSEDCIFCSIVAGDIPARVVYEDDDVLAFLDANPLAPGHTLVIPKDHYETLGDLPADDGESVFAALHDLTPVVEESVDADGSNVAFNNGAAAGQEVPTYTATSFRASRTTAATPSTPSPAVVPSSPTTNLTTSPTTSRRPRIDRAPAASRAGGRLTDGEHRPATGRLRRRLRHRGGRLRGQPLPRLAHRRCGHAPGFAALLVTSGGWAAAQVGFLLAPGADLKVAFHVVGLVVGFSTTGAWLYFCSAYSGRTMHRDPATGRPRSPSSVPSRS